MPVDAAAPAHDADHAANGHGVLFYERDAELVDEVARRLVRCAAEGAAAVVAVRSEHRAAIERRLAASGQDPARTTAQLGWRWLDAREVAGSLCPGGVFDATAFDRDIATHVRGAAAGGRPLRAFGEIVGVLWESGNVLAAAELERAWNALRAEVGFPLLCGYPGASRHDDGAHEVICSLHDEVLGGGDEVRARFDADRSSARAARRLAASVLRGWGRADLVEDACLVVSELAANAVAHAGSGFTLTLRRVGPCVRLAVLDHSPRPPVVRPESHVADGGRGLHIVATLAGRWGTAATGDGKVVWAEVG